MSRVRLLLAVAVVVASACADPAPPAKAPAPRAPAAAPSAEAPRTTPDAPFRQQPPGPDGKVQFVVPTVSEAKLHNGLRVLVAERHDLPIVSVRLVSTLGAGDVPDARPGTLSFLGAMLEEGTKKRSALEISEDYDALGAQHGAHVDWDSGSIHVSRVLTDQLDSALDVLADVALGPTFPESEVERVKARRITAIQAEKSAPATMAQNAIAAVLYGRTHPYGHSLSGEEADAKKLTRSEVVRAYERLFTPQTTALVVAGDMTKDAILPKLEATFGTWKTKPAATKRKPPPLPGANATDKRVVLVDKPGAAQSQVQVVRVGVPYSTKDRDAILVANTILGGSFSSRVNMNLRERHSYTYGARTHFSMRHGAGPFSAGGAMFTDKTGAAIKELLAELDGLRRDGPTDEELRVAKDSLRGAMPARFETTAELANAFAELLVFDLPLDDYAKRAARIEAVTAADVKRVAAELLPTEQMLVVIVGDKAAIAPQLEGLGLGPTDERDAYGDPIAGAPPPPSLQKRTKKR